MAIRGTRDTAVGLEGGGGDQRVGGRADCAQSGDEGARLGEGFVGVAREGGDVDDVGERLVPDEDDGDVVMIQQVRDQLQRHLAIREEEGVDNGDATVRARTYEDVVRWRRRCSGSC